MRPLVDYRPAFVNGQGIGRYVRELVRAICQLDDAEPRLFGPTFAPKEFPPAALGIDRARLFARKLPSKAVTGGFGALGLGVERLFRGGADVCHHTQYRRLPTRLPEVSTIHDLVFLDSDRFVGEAAAQRMSAFVREAARRSSAILTPTECVADEVAERLDVPRERVFATPLGVDHVLRAEPTAPQDVGAPYFFTAARIETRKNLGAILAAFEKVRDSHLRWRIAGIQGDGAEAFLDALRRSPVQGRVDLLGHVTEQQLRAETLGAVAFVLVPHDEGFGLAPLEAMAMGVPAITSLVPVVEEVCGGGGVLVDPQDVDGLAGAMEALAADPAQREAQAEKGRAHAAQYRWERTASRSLLAYRTARALRG